jgi:hypothetical protein
MPPDDKGRGFHQHTSVTDPDAAFASRVELHELSDKVTDLQGALGDHNEHVEQLVNNALQTVLAALPAALEAATERALRRVAMDQGLHAQIGASVLSQATRGMHERVGGWLFSKWAALALLVIVIAQYIGWTATIKALIGLVGGGKP